MQKRSSCPDNLLLLIQQAKENYRGISVKRKRGKPRTYSEKSFLFLALVAVALRTYKAAELYRLLESDSELLKALGFPRLPHRKTISRRLHSLLPEAEEQVRILGEEIKQKVEQNSDCSIVSAIDGRMYEALGPRWHQKDRKRGVIPIGLRNVDCESHWFKSGYRGWVQGYRLVLQGLVFPTPVPLFATWQPNNVGESTIMKQALLDKQLSITDVLLGDTTFGTTDLKIAYQEQGGWLLTPTALPKQNHSWKHDLYAYRKETIELLFQRIIQAFDLPMCPTKGNRNGTFVIASVWLYQIVFLCNYKEGLAVAHVKERLDLARWRIPT